MSWALAAADDECGYSEPVRRTDYLFPETWDRDGLKARGFEGFVPLVGLDARSVPKEHGIYMVLLPDASLQHTFTLDNPVKRARLKKYSIEELDRRWVADTPVLYIGKAMGKEGLRDRLKPFSKRSSSHSGGRAIWQLQNTDALLACWIETPGYRADQVEDDLIDQFKTAHGQTPFANVRERGLH
ncbi:hypothetical protein [Agromyces humi]|uniref:hypothetical protein n=1 Tax=Agromyces humi TaxID=1766800 RepID=UPI001357F625|nr:hypothetical protein [Agromyces humi]